MSATSLYLKHRNIAGRVAGERFAIPGMDRDDIRQEAHIALWIAARTHDPARGTFPPFARLVIQRRLDTLLKAALRQKRAAMVGAAEFVELAGGDEPDRVVVAREALARLAGAIGELSELERRSLLSSLNDEPGDRARVQAVNRARRKLRAAA